MGGRDGSVGYPLFEAKTGKGRLPYRLFASSIFVGVCLIWVYRATHIPVAEEEGTGGGGGGGRRWAWIGLFAAEVWFGLYWVLTQALRWTPLYYTTFKERLSQRFENELPCIDIFVCTADPRIEPPMLVINTVLSVMVYDYPQEKLSVYLSDDGGSKFTYYALLEAAEFSKHWIPLCKKFKIEPRSPAVYFSSISDNDVQTNKDLAATKDLYKEMENRIETAVKLGGIPDNVVKKYKGFFEWRSATKPNDHKTILQIIIDAREPESVDTEGCSLPTLVYLSREKRPNYFHNYKAGALNALIRVSSVISNAPIILNLDCDMYSNNSEIVRDALCFFMDAANGEDVGFVQLPQNFSNLTKNNLYGDSINVVNAMEIPGMNGHGGPCFMGTGCFHRRESISGKKYMKDGYEDLILMKKGGIVKADGNKSMLEERAKVLASCTYEQNTQWGKEMGLKYGCPVEDMITGMSIQCKGWRSMYFNPAREGFLGIAPITLSQMLVQHKRWSEGMFQIFISKYCPLIYGYGKINLPLQMAYSTYYLWGPCSLTTLYYVVVPSLCLLRGIPLFPETSNMWFIPFAYVIFAVQAHSLVEALWSGETLKGWWNMRRTWMMRRIISYFFGLIDTILGKLGFTDSAFVVTAKVADEDVLRRYRNEVMDFGPASPMFTLLSTIALLQVLCLAGGIKMVVFGSGVGVVGHLFLQLLLCGMMALICLPIYHGMFFRRDKGRMPTRVTVESVVLAVMACLLTIL